MVKKSVAQLAIPMIRVVKEKHVILVDGLVEYINRPKEWVEHAMFTQPRPEY
jgi:hypothetical protein